MNENMLTDNNITKTAFLAIAMIIMSIVMGLLAAEFSQARLLIVLAGLLVFVISFINIEFGLYVLIFSMILSPEIMIGAPSQETTTASRGVTVRVEDFLLLIIGASWFAKNAIIKELGLFVKTPLNTSIFLYILACLVSTIIAIMVGRANLTTATFFVLKYFEYFIVFFMVANQIKTERQIKRFIYFIFLACFISSIIGILQIPGGGRVSAPFEGKEGEPNTFGGYLLLIGAVATGIFIKSKSPKEKWILFFLIITIIPPFFFTQSRSSYLGAIPAGMLLVLFAKKKVFVICFAIIALIVSPLFLPKEVKERILYTFKQKEQTGQLKVGGATIDTSTTARLVSWKEAISDWTKHPLFGFGVTGYKFLDAQFPKVLVDTGVVGFAAFIYLLYSMFKILISNFKNLKNEFYQGLSLGLIAGLIGLIFHSLGANTFIIVRVMEPLWFLLGIIVALPRIEQETLGEVVVVDDFRSNKKANSNSVRIKLNDRFRR